jgi:hypothetical protein
LPKSPFPVDQSETVSYMTAKTEISPQLKEVFFTHPVFFRVPANFNWIA